MSLFHQGARRSTNGNIYQLLGAMTLLPLGIPSGILDIQGKFIFIALLTGVECTFYYTDV